MVKNYWPLRVIKENQMKKYMFLLFVPLLSRIILADAKQERCNQFYALENIVTITIDIDPGVWDILRNEFSGSYEWHEAASVTVSGNNFPAQEKKLNHIGLRKKGLSTDDPDNPSLKINYGKYDWDYYHSHYNENQIEGVIGTQHLTLNNAKGEESFMRQCLQNRICREAGMPYSRCNYAIVIVRDKDDEDVELHRSIYVNVEPIKKRFIKHNFGERNDLGNLYEISGDDIDPETIEFEGFSQNSAYVDIQEAQEYIDAGASPSEKASRIKEVIDIDNFMKFWAMEILLKHNDGYTQAMNNSYLYNDVSAIPAPVPPNKDQITFKFIMAGTDQVLRGSSWRIDQYTASYFASLLADDTPSFTELKAHILDLLNTVFDPTTYFTVMVPYMNIMMEILNTIATNAYWQPDEDEMYVVKDQLKQVYSAGYQMLEISPPCDRSMISPLVWVEDALPGNATGNGTGPGNEPWTWVSTPVYSGSLAHQSPSHSGVHQHYFTNNTSTPMEVKEGAELFAYIYLDDPMDMPSEIMLQWHDGSGWARAYWGIDYINWVTPRTFIRAMLPMTGEWARLSVPAHLVGLENKTIYGMAFTLFDGSATWDCAGVDNPAVPIWVEDDDNLPGTFSSGSEAFTWVENPKYSGKNAHQSTSQTGMHEHYFYNAASTMKVKIGAELYTYVYLDPNDPPQEIMLKWYSNNTWTRVYWGSDMMFTGKTRTYMGALPEKGVWTRLSVPASIVGLENKEVSGMSFTLYGGKATWDASGVFNPAINAWVDDQPLPGNATEEGNENWRWVQAPSYPVYSCESAHRSTYSNSVHLHYFSDATSDPMPVSTDAELYTYIYLDSQYPPSEVMLQWRAANQWRQVYWGDDAITWLTRIYMGELPETGKWTKLSVPASVVGLENEEVVGMSFTLYRGKANWDASGVENQGIDAWIEDEWPSNNLIMKGNEECTWVTSDNYPVYNGTKAHQSTSANGMHQHFFDYHDNRFPPMFVKQGSELYTYIYIDPNDAAPTEIMLQWYGYGGGWRRAYWGSDNITWSPRIHMGDIPAKGAWTRLSVPASIVGLENMFVYGMAFTLYDGRATWDCSGVE